MSKIKKPLKDSIILTTYSSLWITGDTHTRNIDGVEHSVTYRPKQFIHTYKNKHMGICTELVNNGYSSTKHVQAYSQYKRCNCSIY